MAFVGSSAATLTLNRIVSAPSARSAVRRDGPHAACACAYTPPRYAAGATKPVTTAPFGIHG